MKTEEQIKQKIEFYEKQQRETKDDNYKITCGDRDFKMDNIIKDCPALIGEGDCISGKIAGIDCSNIEDCFVKNLEKDYIELQEDYTELKQTYDACEDEYKRLAGQYNTLLDRYNKLILNPTMSTAEKKKKGVVK